MSVQGFIKSCNEGSDIGHFIEAAIQYPEELYEIDNYLPFFPERMKIGKAKKLIST